MPRYLAKMLHWLVLLAAILSGGTADPQNGDIRLANGTSFKGRLEVYNASQQTWGTVCYDSRELEGLGQLGAARAACRQLQFNDVKYVNDVTALNIPEAPESTPILLYQLNCVYNYVTDLNDETEHILRCSYVETGNCTHAQDLAIQCDSMSKYNDSYGSEVRLTNGSYPSSGVVEVYLNGRWGTVCADESDDDFAHVVCKQMGYTSQSGHSAINITTLGVPPALQSFVCISSDTCLSECIYSYPPATDVITCANNQIATVNCTFKEKRSSTTPGSEYLCAIDPPVPTPPVSNSVVRLAEIIGGVIGGISLAIVVIVIVLLCCCFISGCPLNTWRDRRLHGYSSIT